MSNLKVFNIQNLNIFFISILPIGLIVGSLISNTIIILICIFFLYDLIKKKNLIYLDKFNFYFLIIINIYLFLNSFFISENSESLIKSIGFFRFIILAYAISYYFIDNSNKILKVWTLLFLIVTLDILFEYTFGKNILGFESAYKGRISSFTGDELKIGGYYFGFIFLCLLFLSRYKQKYFLFFSVLFFITSLLIGERSNFIKIFIMYFLFFTFFSEMKFFKKFFVIILLISIPVLIIFSSQDFKNRYIYQIIGKELIEKFQIERENINYRKVISENRHLSHYYVATNIFKDNILFGSGFKSFRIESPKNKYKKDGIYGASTHPHQFHFEILSELGIVGYLLVFSNLIYVLSMKFRRKNHLLELGSFLFIIASLIPILPSGSFFTSYGATIFFINYSFLIRPNNINNIKNKSE
tara:strand:- start:1500 stop:2738 length:1239 start_codon:yes stop_codon:yes gene_type:complete